jgi:hypothetical protein
MENRLERIESSLSDLKEHVRALETRLQRLERADGGAVEPAVAVETAPPIDETVRPAMSPGAALPTAGFDSFGPVLPLAGRSVLVLGGAFLVRILTEAGTLAPTAGVAVGLLYAVVWLALADRAAARGASLSAAFLGISSLLIACPLVWEATTRFRAVAAPVALAVLAALVALAVTVGYRRRLHSLVWAATLLPIGTALGLVTTPGAIVPLCLFLLALGVATSVLAEGGRFAGPRWAAAVAADGTLLLVVQLVARPGGAPESYGPIAASSVLVLCLLLPLAYLGAFGFHSLVLKRAPDLFEGLQSAAAIAAGLGGALQIAHGLPAESRIALAGVILGGATYLTAFAFAERHPSQTGNFLYFSSLAPLLVLISTGPTLPGPPAALLRNALAIFTAIAAVRFRRRALGIHSAVFLIAATAVSGFFQTSLACFLAPGLPPAIPGEVLREAIAAAAVYAILALGARDVSEKWAARLPAALSAGLALLGFGALVLVVLGRSSAIARDPGALAAARTAVLSISAVALAYAGRRGKRAELTWIAWALLAAGAGKILVQDLPSGRAATLFLSFLFYGAALILAPRFLGRRRAEGGRTQDVSA